MYGGVIRDRIVYCCHPVVVVGSSGVAASFGDVDEALRFLAKRGFGFGAVYRHSGSNWDRVIVDPLVVLESLKGNTNGPGGSARRRS
jgi:hypothetical protein